MTLASRLLSRVLVLALLVPAHATRAQDSARLAVPFGVGERLEYEVRFGALRVGGGSMEVEGIKDVRGRETWHTVFTVRGGTFFYRVNDRSVTASSFLPISSLHRWVFLERCKEGRFNYRCERTHQRIARCNSNHQVKFKIRFSEPCTVSFRSCHQAHTFAQEVDLL